MVEVAEVAEQRMARLKKANPERTFEDDYMDTEAGTRGLIRIFGFDGEVSALEFIEPEELWADPDALEEYSETLSDGLGVTVIVPSEEKAGAEGMLRETVGDKVVVLGYDDIGKSLDI